MSFLKLRMNCCPIWVLASLVRLDFRFAIFLNNPSLEKSGPLKQTWNPQKICGLGPCFSFSKGVFSGQPTLFSGLYTFDTHYFRNLSGPRCTNCFQTFGAFRLFHLNNPKRHGNLPSWELTYPPTSFFTFESMMFLFHICGRV